MARITASAPVLLVADVVAAAEHFRDRLGFSYDRFYGEPPGFCMVQRDGHTVMLSQVAAGVTVVPNWKVVQNMWDVYFWVDDVEAMYEEMRASGATIDYELCTQPYGVREFGVQDIDGHDIAFGQVLDE